MNLRVTFACLLALALLPALSSPAPAEAKRLEDRLEKIARERVNVLRAKHGLPSLRGSRRLARSAARYAQFMLRRGYFGHLARIRAPGLFRPMGEILLLRSGGHGRPREAVRLWAGSGGHLSVMLLPHARQIGLGRASGRFGGRAVTVWVGHIGRR